MNFDDAHCDEVRDFFVESALHWLRNYHMDGLRLDAVHALYDFSARPFLCELVVRTSEFSVQEGRRVVLIVESDLNDSKVVRSLDSEGPSPHSPISTGNHLRSHSAKGKGPSR